MVLRQYELVVKVADDLALTWKVICPYRELHAWSDYAPTRTKAEKLLRKHLSEHHTTQGEML